MNGKGWIKFLIILVTYDLLEKIYFFGIDFYQNPLLLIPSPYIIILPTLINLLTKQKYQDKILIYVTLVIPVLIYSLMTLNADQQGLQFNVRRQVFLTTVLMLSLPISIYALVKKVKLTPEFSKLILLPALLPFSLIGMEIWQTLKPHQGAEAPIGLIWQLPLLTLLILVPYLYYNRTRNDYLLAAALVLYQATVTIMLISQVFWST